MSLILHRALRPLAVLLLSAGFLLESWASDAVTNCTETALRSAMTAGGDVIIGCDGSIPITSTLVISKDTVLDGSGHAFSLISGELTNLTHLLVVQPGVHLTLRNLTVSGTRYAGRTGTNGASGEPGFGAAVFNDSGLLQIEDCAFSNHFVSGGNGSDAARAGDRGGNGGSASAAAIFNNAGQLLVTNTIFSGNVTAGGQGGGGGGGATGGNGSQGGQGGDGGDGRGAAIYNAAGGMVTIYGSLFLSNRVSGSAAGAGGAAGGVLGFPGKAGRSGSAVGAALFSESGVLTIVNSTFIGNSGVGADGRAGYDGTSLRQAVAGRDGGTALGSVFTSPGTVALTNCTFVGNTSTGGIGGKGGNGGAAGFGGPGGDGGNGGAAHGAGIYAAGDTAATVVNCTFATNTVVAANGGAGGVGTGLARNGSSGHAGQATGNAVFGDGTGIRLRNSILAGGGIGINGDGSIIDEGFNFSSDASPAFASPGSQNTIDPGLGSLVSTGGVGSTLALATNSPARDAIVSPTGNGCPIYDQRNLLRAEPCDIGAYEVGAVSSTLGLTAVRQAGQIAIAWPALTTPALQQTTSLSGAPVWTTVSDAITTTNGVRQLLIGNPTGARFFRLTNP